MQLTPYHPASHTLPKAADQEKLRQTHRGAQFSGLVLSRFANPEQDTAKTSRKEGFLERFYRKHVLGITSIIAANGQQWLQKIGILHAPHESHLLAFSATQKALKDDIELPAAENFQLEMIPAIATTAIAEAETSSTSATETNAAALKTRTASNSSLHKRKPNHTDDPDPVKQQADTTFLKPVVPEATVNAKATGHQTLDASLAELPEPSGKTISYQDPIELKEISALDDLTPDNASGTSTSSSLEIIDPLPKTKNLDDLEAAWFVVEEEAKRGEAKNGKPEQKASRLSSLHKRFSLTRG